MNQSQPQDSQNLDLTSLDSAPRGSPEPDSTRLRLYQRPKDCGLDSGLVQTLVWTLIILGNRKLFTDRFL